MNAPRRARELQALAHAARRLRAELGEPTTVDQAAAALRWPSDLVADLLRELALRGRVRRGQAPDGARTYRWAVRGAA
jgi:hypothetical protein